jgi:hypothetical protein
LNRKGREGREGTPPVSWRSQRAGNWEFEDSSSPVLLRAGLGRPELPEAVPKNPARCAVRLTRRVALRDLCDLCDSNEQFLRVLRVLGGAFLVPGIP